MKRNRRERRSAEVYRLQKLLSSGEYLEVDGEKHYIEGSLENRLVVSVPETTTHAAASAVQNRMQMAVGKPVIVISHNIEFLHAVKLSSSEAARVIAKVQDAKGKESGGKIDGVGGGSRDSGRGDVGVDDVRECDAKGGVPEVCGDTSAASEGSKEGED